MQSALKNPTGEKNELVCVGFIQKIRDSVNNELTNLIKARIGACTSCDEREHEKDIACRDSREQRDTSNDSRPSTTNHEPFK